MCIDSFTNHSFVCNEALLMKVHKHAMKVASIHGEDMVEKMGILPGFGDALITPRSNTNGLALCEIKERYTVTYARRKHIKLQMSPKFFMLFLYDKKLGCYACEFTDQVLNKLKRA